MGDTCLGEAVCSGLKWFLDFAPEPWTNPQVSPLGEGKNPQDLFSLDVSGVLHCWFGHLRPL